MKTEEFLENIYLLSSNNNFIEATDLLVKYIDDLCIDNKVEEIKTFLNIIEINKVHINILTGIFPFIYYYKSILNSECERFIIKCIYIHNLPEQRIQELYKRFIK